MHHLILVREWDQQVSGSACCGRLEAGLSDHYPPEADYREWRVRMDQMGAIYRAVRARFGDEVEITVLDSRNVLSFLSLIARDAFRYHVPPGTALRAAMSNSLSTGIFDGQLLFAGSAPEPDVVVDLIAGRLVIHSA